MRRVSSDPVGGWEKGKDIAGHDHTREEVVAARKGRSQQQPTPSGRIPSCGHPATHFGVLCRARDESRKRAAARGVLKLLSILCHSRRPVQRGVEGGPVGFRLPQTHTRPSPPSALPSPPPFSLHPPLTRPVLQHDGRGRQHHRQTQAGGQGSNLRPLRLRLGLARTQGEVGGDVGVDRRQAQQRRGGLVGPGVGQRGRHLTGGRRGFREDLAFGAWRRRVPPDGFPSLITLLTSTVTASKPNHGSRTILEGRPAAEASASTWGRT